MVCIINGQKELGSFLLFNSDYKWTLHRESWTLSQYQFFCCVLQMIIKELWTPPCGLSRHTTSKVPKSSKKCHKSRRELKENDLAISSLCLRSLSSLVKTCVQTPLKSGLYEACCFFLCRACTLLFSINIKCQHKMKEDATLDFHERWCSYVASNTLLWARQWSLLP